MNLLYWTLYEAKSPQEKNGIKETNKETNTGKG